MLPIGDDNWDRRRRPVVTVVLVAVNVLVFFYELHLAALGRPAIQGFISRWGVVPLEYARQVDLPPGATTWFPCGGCVSGTTGRTS